MLCLPYAGFFQIMFIYIKPHSKPSGLILKSWFFPNVSWYSIPGKTYGLREVDAKTRKCSLMSLFLIKDKSKFHVFINIVFQKYDPYSMFLKNEFDIFYVYNLIMDHLTIWRKKRWPLTVDVFWYNGDFISFLIFFNL